VTCAGCNRSANGDSLRYGSLWCTECVAAIDFEERLARENEMAVEDVFVKDGHLAFVLSGRNQHQERPLSMGLTYGDVLHEINNAATQFTRHLVIADDGTVVISHGAVDSARQLLAVITKYKPLLAPPERESMEYAQRLARLVVGGVQ